MQFPKNEAARECPYSDTLQLLQSLQYSKRVQKERKVNNNERKRKSREKSANKENVVPSKVMKIPSTDFPFGEKDKNQTMNFS